MRIQRYLEHRLGSFRGLVIGNMLTDMVQNGCGHDASVVRCPYKKYVPPVVQAVIPHTDISSQIVSLVVTNAAITIPHAKIKSMLLNPDRHSATLMLNQDFEFSLSFAYEHTLNLVFVYEHITLYNEWNEILGIKG